MKVAEEQYVRERDPDDFDRSVSPKDQAAMARDHIRGRLAALGGFPVRSQACLYTLAPQGDFLVREKQPGLVAVSTCSGHGFKHAPALGEVLASLLTGGSGESDLSPFMASPTLRERKRGQSSERTGDAGGLCECSTGFLQIR